MITFNPLWNVNTNTKKTGFCTCTSVAVAALSSISSSSGLSESLSEIRAKTVTVSMKTIFKKPALFQLFVSHALHEFCAENIFAYIEMKQFRDAFAMKYRKCQATDSDTTYLYQLPDHATQQIPYSNIVFDKLDLEKKYADDELKKAAKQIFMCFYEKYITDNAPTQVNIGYDVRKQYDAYYIVEVWNLTMDEILQLYDPILRETALLLMDVKYRFARSEEFIKYNTTELV
eukprot:UN11856